MKTKKLDSFDETAYSKKEKTNKKMMILSCIGIVLVVLSHTGNQIKLVSDIFPNYSFHMALFIFISGYFYNSKYEKNLFGKNGYILKKIKKLVVPYFIWNLIYGILVMLFRKANIVPWGETINIKSLFIEPWITGHQFILNIPSWFLLSLFLVNIIYILIRKIINKIRLWNDYIAIIIFFMISMISIYLSKNNIGRMYIPLIRTGFFMFFYHLGYIYKTKIEEKIKINSTIYFLLLIIIQLIVLKLDNKITYVACFMEFNCKFIITPIIVSCTGILFWTKISEILVPALGDSRIINHISNNTYDIMLHHLFWIFILNVCIFKVSNIINLSGFNIDIFKNTIYYHYTAGISQAQIIYTIIAITMPLISRYIYEKIKLRVIYIKMNKNEN